MGILVKVVKSKYLKVELQSELDFLKKKQKHASYARPEILQIIIFFLKWPV